MLIQHLLVRVLGFVRTEELVPISRLLAFAGLGPRDPGRFVHVTALIHLVDEDVVIGVVRLLVIGLRLLEDLLDGEQSRVVH